MLSSRPISTSAQLGRQAREQANNRTGDDSRHDADAKAPHREESDHGDSYDEPVGMPTGQGCVAGDEDAERSNHADNSDGDAVQRGCEGPSRADPVDEGSAVDDEDEGGDEGAERGN